MNTQMLKTVGQFAGIGGIALGVFLLFFLELTRKSIFSKLKQDHTYNLLKLVTILLCSVSITWIIFGRKPEQSPESPSASVSAGRDLTAGKIQIDQSTSSSILAGAVSAGRDINASDITVKQ